MNFPSYVTDDLKQVYQAFYNMHSRCYNPNYTRFSNWGGRGIKIEGIWNLAGKEGLDAFMSDMGLPPSTLHSLDRIDNDKNYSKSNCRWALPEVQALNKSTRQYSISRNISFDKRLNKYKLYRLNLDLKLKTYLGIFNTMNEADAFWEGLVK